MQRLLLDAAQNLLQSLPQILPLQGRLVSAAKLYTALGKKTDLVF